MADAFSMHSDDDDYRTRLSEVLIGRRIVKCDREAKTFTLDNGTVLQVQPNVGGCSCNNGDFQITDMQMIGGVITRADATVKNGESDEQFTYNIFVYAANVNGMILTVEGWDNGYYGTGYELVVTEEGEYAA
jgi:hypothetical protein